MLDGIYSFIAPPQWYRLYPLRGIAQGEVISGRVAEVAFSGFR